MPPRQRYCSVTCRDRAKYLRRKLSGGFFRAEISEQETFRENGNPEMSSHFCNGDLSGNGRAAFRKRNIPVSGFLSVGTETEIFPGDFSVRKFLNKKLSGKTETRKCPVISVTDGTPEILSGRKQADNFPREARLMFAAITRERGDS
ncbi:hypothetical protein HMPREF0578_1879 [Mobiluncus mulieris 28-1]|nr:hypothetical protein HMPREF0578_1879 [Mobiluncus mulieris 28-1]